MSVALNYHEIWSVTAATVDGIRWKNEDEMLAKRVSAAEHLCSDWSKYENDCREAETSVNKLETELDVVVADTEPQHVHSCLERLQVRSLYIPTNSHSNSHFAG